MNTQIRAIDGTYVLFQYGQPVPAFDTWTLQQPGRTFLALDGTWKWAEDARNEGTVRGWFAPTFDDSSWPDRPVPASWDLYDTPGFGSYDGVQFGTGSAFYDGYTWYRRHLTPPAVWIGHFVKLIFLAVSYECWVYVNGRLVGQHHGGNTPFALDASRHLLPGRDNVIAVRVYRRPWWTSYTKPGAQQITAATEVPHKPVDYWPYAGITRSVNLEATGLVTISKVLTATGDHVLSVRAVLYNHGDRVERRQLVIDPGAGGDARFRELSIHPGQVAVEAFRFAIPRARWWSPTSPTVYALRATLYRVDGQGRHSLDDRLDVVYGMRTVAVDNARLLLNGRPIFLKGVNWHEETAAHRRSLTAADYDRELGRILDLNANFARNCVYNRHPYAYEYADRHGLLMLDDSDNMWLDTAQQALQMHSYGLSRAMVATMAWNELNHPAVIMWSLQNESEIGHDGDAWVYRARIAEMVATVKALDIQDRPVTWASSSSWDPAFELADVVGFNEYFGYFYMHDSDLGKTLDQVHRNWPAKPILITENGTYAYPGSRGAGPATEQGSEAWQAAAFQSHWQQVTVGTDTLTTPRQPRLRYMAGYTYWLLKDYKQRLQYNRQHNGISTMGMVTFDTETPRLIYQAFKDASNPVPRAWRPRPFRRPPYRTVRSLPGEGVTQWISLLTKPCAFGSRSSWRSSTAGLGETTSVPFALPFRVWGDSRTLWSPRR